MFSARWPIIAASLSDSQSAQGYPNWPVAVTHLKVLCSTLLYVAYYDTMLAVPSNTPAAVITFTFDSQFIFQNYFRQPYSLPFRKQFPKTTEIFFNATVLQRFPKKNFDFSNFGLPRTLKKGIFLISQGLLAKLFNNTA